MPQAPPAGASPLPPLRLSQILTTPCMDRPMSVASDLFFDVVIHPTRTDTWKTGAKYMLQPDSEDDLDDDEPVSEI